MHFRTLVFTILSALLLDSGVDACKMYKNCKCYDNRTNAQDNKVTEAACGKYHEWHSTGVTYTPDDAHSCRTNKDIGGGLMDNCDWNEACRNSGETFFQYCWNKKKWP